MNIALILSGGTGSRLGSLIPKQYIEVGHKMIISYSIDLFDRHPDIDAIQIVADRQWRGVIDAGDTYGKLRGYSDPGSSSQLSILNGLEDILKYADKSDRVIIHDAARPCVSAQLISSVIAACREHDGGIPVLPMKDTVYMGDEKRITALCDRNQVYAGQAPEGFILGKYYEANKQLLPQKIFDINGSTEPAVMAGMDIMPVAGDEANFKITTGMDLERFRSMIEI
jgi:2-C-methyl-D-erythritol 4-phosphate cytidylyltransferase